MLYTAVVERLYQKAPQVSSGFPLFSMCKCCFAMEICRLTRPCHALPGCLQMVTKRNQEYFLPDDRAPSGSAVEAQLHKLAQQQLDAQKVALEAERWQKVGAGLLACVVVYVGCVDGWLLTALSSHRPWNLAGGRFAYSFPLMNCAACRLPAT